MAAPRGLISLALESFKVDQEGLAAMMSTNVARDLIARAVAVEHQAKTYATGVGGGPNVRTGLLRGSITWRLGVDNAGPYADIGSAVAYAPFVELGTIYMSPRPFLRPALAAARI